VRASLSILVFALAGCASSVTVSGTVQHPATVPLRTFPRVFVSSGPSAEEITIAQDLVAHLREGEAVEARRVAQEELEPMRLRGELPPTSVVVLIETSFDESSSARWTTRPETVCGPAGCYTRSRTTTYDVPHLRARVRLTVFDGPSARVLQRLAFDVVEEGRSYGQMRGRAVRDLRQRLERLVDRREEDVRVHLLEVAEVPEVTSAIGAIETGDWRAGRIALERAVRSDRVRALSAERKARVFYDLGVARRFDPVSLARDPERHFEAAESPLRRAVRLHPHRRYAQALQEVQRHRQQITLLREQEEAAQHNRSLESTPPTSPVPQPPPAYR